MDSMRSSLSKAERLGSYVPFAACHRADPPYNKVLGALEPARQGGGELTARRPKRSSIAPD